MNDFKLIRCNNEEYILQMHEIREKVLFPHGNYDRNHPDDVNPNHHCFIFLLNKTAVGTVRLDFFHSHEAAVRLVAVLPKFQGQKIGSKMLFAIEKYAKKNGVTRLVTNATVDAKKFYASIGYIQEDWIDPGEGTSEPTISMSKRLKSGS